MIEYEAAVSTKQASELLGVHESSIKRWCNSNHLECWSTPGGHRRIPIHALLTYARSANIAFALDAFGSEAGRVWDGTEKATDGASFEALVTIFFEWTIQRKPNQLIELLAWLRKSGFSAAQLADGLIVPVMSRVGKEYAEGKLSIGDEHRMTGVLRDALIGWCLNGSKLRYEQEHVAIVGCARAEVHELGALMVRKVLEEAGWTVVYLGLNVPTEEFADQQVKHRATLVCISMTPPAGMAEAQTITSLLDSMYSPHIPYRLALGGGAARPDDRSMSTEYSFVDLAFFQSLNPFNSWFQGA